MNCVILGYGTPRRPLRSPQNGYPETNKQTHVRKATPMTITLQLSPEEETTLRTRAQAQGTDVEAVLHSLVAQLPPSPEKPVLNERQKAAIAMIDAWREEDKTDDEEELDRRDRELEELMANMSRWRAEEGRPPV